MMDWLYYLLDVIKRAVALSSFHLLINMIARFYRDKDSYIEVQLKMLANSYSKRPDPIYWDGI